MNGLITSLNRLWESFWTAIMRRFVEYASDDPGTHHEVGEILERQGKLDLALRHFNRSIELAPLESRHYTARSRVYFCRKIFEEGLADARRALEIDPQDDLAMYLKGVCLEGMGDRNEAIRCINDAISLKPHELSYQKACEDLKSRRTDG